jgi:hypothetical protein
VNDGAQEPQPPDIHGCEAVERFTPVEEESAMNRKLLKDCLPDFARELELLLINEQDPELAQQVELMQVDVDTCGSDDDFCSMLCTGFKPKNGWGRGDTSIVLKPEQGNVLLNMLDCDITAVEVFFRKDIQEKVKQLRM